MFNRLLLILSLVFLFGFGQQAAVVHAVSHLADAQESSQHKSAPHTQSCEKCAAYAQLGSALHGGAVLPPVFDSAHVTQIALAVNVAATHYAFYAARAPPVLG